MPPLGLVLTPYGQIPGSFPYEIGAQTYGSRQLCPEDPYYLQRGEYGYFHDTALGAPRTFRSRLKKLFGLGEIPTDFEKASVYQYLPVTAGWVTTSQGYYPTHWMPPDGGATWYGPAVAPLSGAFGDATSDDLIRVLNEHHKKQFQLSALSTTAVVASSLITAYRTVRLIIDERRTKNEGK